MTENLFIWREFTAAERIVVERWALGSQRHLYVTMSDGPIEELFTSTETGMDYYLHLKTELLSDPAAYRADIARVGNEVAAEIKRQSAANIARVQREVWGTPRPSPRSFLDRLLGR